jgi:hypothetical protein
MDLGVVNRRGRSHATPGQSGQIPGRRALVGARRRMGIVKQKLSTFTAGNSPRVKAGAHDLTLFMHMEDSRCLSKVIFPKVKDYRNAAPLHAMVSSQPERPCRTHSHNYIKYTSPSHPTGRVRILEIFGPKVPELRLLHNSPIHRTNLVLFFHRPPFIQRESSIRAR